MPKSKKNFVLVFESPDRLGIVARLAPSLSESRFDIREAYVYCDDTTEHFFSRKLKVLIAVSKFDDCLVDLIHKWRVGTLPIEIVGVVSNHLDCASIALSNGLEYHHLPISKDTKMEQERAFRELISQTKTDLVVLARYMQILSDSCSRQLSGQCINIHHSFLPSFKGAKPYHQAHDRCVKLIGVTADFFTSDLDEGPITEQDVRGTSHATTAKEMMEIGREIQASVLSRAVKWFAEHRVLLSGHRTVVLQS